MTRDTIDKGAPFWAWALTLLIALGLCVTTLSPAVPSVGPPGSDKLQHFIGFALLALPLAYARPQWGLRIVVCVFAFGALIEVIQPSVGRSAEWADLAADMAGATTAVLAMRLWRR